VKKNWNSGTYKQLELKGVIAYLLYNGCASFMGMQAEEQLRKRKCLTHSENEKE